MKKLLIILPFILLSLTVFGQEGNLLKKETKRNAIIFTPLNILDLFNPSFQVGYQRVLNKKWEAQLEIGMLLKAQPWIGFFENNFDFTDSVRVNHKGFRLRLEIKYFLKQNKVNKYYVSSELFYLKNNTRTTESFIPSEGFSYQEFYLNKKKKYGLNIKYGVKILMGKRLFFDAHIGIGVSFREVRHKNRENLNDKLDTTDFWEDSKAVGNKWVFNFPLNGKIGYRF